MADLKAQENELQAQVGVGPLFPTEGAQYDDKAAHETRAISTARFPSCSQLTPVILFFLLAASFGTFRAFTGSFFLVF